MSTKKLQIIGNIGGGSNVEIDTTLTQEGKAADAKAVGEYISNLASDVQIQLNSKVAEVLQAAYPVGAIYLSINNISPASLFGGTWEQIEDTFLLASGSAYIAGSTGGQAAVKLSKEQMPNVIGDITMHSGGSATNISNVSGCFSSQLTNTGQYRNGGTVGTTANSIGIIHFDNGGKGLEHNNMPPYLTVYMWKRIE